jgi:O-methyltransferase
MNAPTPFPPSWTRPAGWMQQFLYFMRIFDRNRICDVPGDIVECGVGEGTTFAMLAYLAGRHKRCLRGFDSFAGFPKVSEHDRSWRNPQPGEWKVDQSIPEKLLEVAGIHAEFPSLSITITTGSLEETLPKEPPYQIAFLHLDVDIYWSYRVSLEQLFPRVSIGGVVMFDEYREFSTENLSEEKWPGATKAIDDYLIPRGYTPSQDASTGKWYVVKKKQ